MGAVTGDNPVAAVIGRILDMEHEVSLIAEDATWPLRAWVASISPGASVLTLHTLCEEAQLQQYLTDGTVTFDFQRQRGQDTDILSFERVEADVVRQRENLFEIRCHLPRSMVIRERRGGVRVPFIQGMYARARLQIYRSGVAVDGRLRDLSVGGCLIDCAIRDSVALRAGQDLPELKLEFPDGTRFRCPAQVRHMRPLGSSGRIAVGLQFDQPQGRSNAQLASLVLEAERELAYRTGMEYRAAGISPLFVASQEEQRLQEQLRRQQEQHRNQPAAVAALHEVAHQLQVILLFLKSRDHMPEGTLFECTDLLLDTLQRSRRQLLFSLPQLRTEPDWVRHAITVAVHLADLLQAHPDLQVERRDAVAGTLLHTLGKPLLLSDALPSLDVPLTTAQRQLLRGHVNALTARLQAVGWRPPVTTREVIRQACELPDGSGYPWGRSGATVGPLIRMLGVIKGVDRLTHGRNDHAAMTPVAAYRALNEAPARYDRDWLVAYIRRFGPTPIGSLARFSKGFLAWIQDTDSRGQPTAVHVVKNLAYPDTNLDTTLAAPDIHQIGELDTIIDPATVELHERQDTAPAHS